MYRVGWITVGVQWDDIYRLYLMFNDWHYHVVAFCNYQPTSSKRATDQMTKQVTLQNK
jgi:hypothetical protein